MSKDISPISSYQLHGLVCGNVMDQKTNNALAGAETSATQTTTKEQQAEKDSTTQAIEEMAIEKAQQKGLQAQTEEASSLFSLNH